MIAYDLFAGCGGASLGLTEAGYGVLGFEVWPVAVNTHWANVGPCALADLSTFDWTEWTTPDALWASPPCQPFSTAGDGAGEDDPRDGMPWFLAAVDALRPPVVIMENVQGLTFEKHRPHLDAALDRLRSYGYEVQWRVLCAADYGVPQTRRRLFVVARSDGGRITWPTVTHTEHPGLFTERWVSMADALGWGSEVDIVKTSGQWIVTDQKSVNGGCHTPTFDAAGQPARTVTEIGMKLVGTQRKNTHLRDEANWPHERPATTVHTTERISAPGHHDEDDSGSQQADAIPVTIAELARLQDFPDGFTFCGTKTDQARQVGNAVPRRMARLLAEANRPVHQPKEIPAQ